MGVILLPVVEVMWVERSGACETGFVGEENIRTSKFFNLSVLVSGTDLQTVYEGGSQSCTF